MSVQNNFVYTFSASCCENADFFQSLAHQLHNSNKNGLSFLFFNQEIVWMLYQKGITHDYTSVQPNCCLYVTLMFCMSPAQPQIFLENFLKNLQFSAQSASRRMMKHRQMCLYKLLLILKHCVLSLPDSVVGFEPSASEASAVWYYDVGNPESCKLLPLFV